MPKYFGCNMDYIHVLGTKFLLCRRCLHWSRLRSCQICDICPSCLALLISLWNGHHMCDILMAHGLSRACLFFIYLFIYLLCIYLFGLFLFVCLLLLFFVLFFFFFFFFFFYGMLYTISLRKHAYSNVLKILPPKTENFEIKNSDIFHISAQKHRLWVLVRTASTI